MGRGSWRAEGAGGRTVDTPPRRLRPIRARDDGGILAISRQRATGAVCEVEQPVNPPVWLSGCRVHKGILAPVTTGKLPGLPRGARRARGREHLLGGPLRA